ncbi:MAG: response regulator [Planctomycetia bacterium]|nr:response regulator [Planctomycetia bacterium]
MPPAPDTPLALLISRDLFFTSKVSGAAEALGIKLTVVGDAATAARVAGEGNCRCVFIDLADAGLDVSAYFRHADREKTPPVIAFGSHVATARLQEARDAGCTHVMPRSRFSATLPELLKQYCQT